MDLLTENVSPNLVKYLRILSHSNKWQEALKKARDTYLLNKGTFKQQANKGVLDNLMKSFFIPLTAENKRYISTFLSMNKISTKYHFTHCNSVSPKPFSLIIDSPCVVIQVFDKLNKEEWKDLMKDYNRIVKLNKAQQISLYDKELKKEGYLSRKWNNIDLLLEIFEMDQKQMSPLRIKNAISEMKQKGLLPIKSRTSYSLDDIRRMRDQIKELIKSFP